MACKTPSVTKAGRERGLVDMKMLYSALVSILASTPARKDLPPSGTIVLTQPALSDPSGSASAAEALLCAALT